MSRVYFVTGTDTGVGKTYVSAGLLKAAMASGYTTAAMKPLAVGCIETTEGLRNVDVLLLQRHCSLPLSYEQINPVALALPLPPHIAAAQAGRRLNVERLLGFCRAVLMQKADLTVIEGSGGWRVPLNARHTLAELPRSLDILVILVVGIQQGCINHALLTAEAIRADGLKLFAWVANHIVPEMPFAEDTVSTLEALLDAPCLASLPYKHNFQAGDCADQIDLSLILPDLSCQTD
jgi:dethiobiotin synthetase